MNDTSSNFQPLDTEKQHRKQHAQFMEVQAARVEYLAISEHLDVLIRETRLDIDGLQPPNSLPAIATLGKLRTGDHVPNDGVAQKPYPEQTARTQRR
jgi:hypothetical protein